MKILVVEDEHRIATSLKKGLEQEHYAVDLAFDGEQGYDLAYSEDYDAIILDLMLPKLDGLSVCRQLRANKIHSPIIILTAKSQVGDKVQLLNSGADDYLTKPFSFDELLARLRAVTRRPKTTLNSTLTVNGLSLDTANFTVSRFNNSIQLSSKEFSLLEFLMRHPGQIISKERIIAHVWDYDSNVLPNTVEVYIKKLRAKIDLPYPDKQPLINTVRGFGYYLGDKNV